MSAPVFQIEFTQDIKKPVLVQHCGNVVFTGDNLSDTISVSVLEDGEPYAISGTVAMNCIRADGATVTVTGSVSGNTASATLTQACVAIPGPLAVVIKVTSDSTTTTLLKAVYMVDVGVTGTAVDPGTIIPDVTTLINAIETAVGSIPADYSDLLATIAPDFVSGTYNKDQYVWNNGTLYRFTDDHSGSWTGTDVEAVVIGDELTNLKNAIKESEYGYENFGLYGTFVRGAMINGELLPSYSYRVSTDTIMSFDRDIVVEIADGFTMAAFYFEDETYKNNSGYVTGTFIIPSGKHFKIEIKKTPEVIVEANISEFVHALKFKSVVGEAVTNYNNQIAVTLAASDTYAGYFKLNSTALTSSTDLYTKKYVIPTGTTKVYIKTRFSGLMGVAFSDITDPTTDYLGYPANCTKDPTSAYASLTDHVKTYTLDRYYKCVYVPYYVPWGEPIVIAYRESAFDTFWKGIHPLKGKNILTFGDSITYTSARWRDEFYRITRAKEIACISQVGAHLTDYNTTTPLDGNYMSTADGGVHNVVCNQVYYWLTNMPSEIEPDIIIISAGTNDTQTVEQLETDINVYTDSSGWLDVDTIERTSFEGAMRWITSKLREEYPYAEIVFASPIQSAQAIHAMEYQLAKEAKMEKVCKRLSANLIKATSESGITGEFEVNNGMGRYLNDGLHPNALGGVVLGTYYANVLEDIFKTLPRH